MYHLESTANARGYHTADGASTIQYKAQKALRYVTKRRRVFVLPVVLLAIYCFSMWVLPVSRTQGPELYL